MTRVFGAAVTSWLSLSSFTDVPWGCKVRLDPPHRGAGRPFHPQKTSLKLGKRFRRGEGQLDGKGESPSLNNLLIPASPPVRSIQYSYRQTMNCQPQPCSVSSPGVITIQLTAVLRLKFNLLSKLVPLPQAFHIPLRDCPPFIKTSFTPYNEE